ncbi:unnamed protein product [Adineta ricciae]|uniref:Phosphatidylinositol glycan anchor biosynthesis class U protein n=1 Tax=Adineta ricciae TaxID=249248 RepID=A0A813YIP1_ADIRI|nr:unnamed protein product [Adineta ricciae]CAF1119359.1 unnamed protein product [Adineta ricciae]
MLNRVEARYFGIGLILRIFFVFFQSTTRHYFENSGEFVTPLNSWKRIIEGIYLRQLNVSPFLGSIVHETPLSLLLFTKLYIFKDEYIEVLFIILDLLSAFFTYKAAHHILTHLYDRQTENKSAYKEDSKVLWLTKDHVQKSAHTVLLCAMVNPLSIGTCVAKSSLVIHNLLLTMTFYFFMTYRLIPFIFTLCLASSISMYPIVLIVPGLLQFSSNANNKRSIVRMFLVFALFVCTNVTLLFVNFHINHQSWSFIDAIYHFIFYVPDYTPNTGIFWYFFTEMFEHFRSLFVWTFQMHVLLLYLFPFTIRLRNEPAFLFWLLCAIFCIFKSYPAYGDVAFYINYLPIWCFLFRYVRNGLVIVCMILVAMLMTPITWYLWIYAGSANANFYFAMTLVFNVAQTFLLSDLLYAYLKRQFFLKNGLNIPNINGKEGQVEFL